MKWSKPKLNSLGGIKVRSEGCCNYGNKDSMQVICGKGNVDINDCQKGSRHL